MIAKQARKILQHKGRFIENLIMNYENLATNPFTICIAKLLDQEI